MRIGRASEASVHTSTVDDSSSIINIEFIVNDGKRIRIICISIIITISLWFFFICLLSTAHSTPTATAVTNLNARTQKESYKNG